MVLGNSKAGLPGSSSSQFQGNGRAALMEPPFLFNVQVRETPDYDHLQSLGMPLGRQRLNSVVTVGWPPTPLQRPTASTTFLQHILVRYIKFIAETVDPRGRQQKFVHRLHWNVCFTHNICECERYCSLILHFDRCRYFNCRLCQPVREYGYAQKIGAFQPCSDMRVGNHVSGDVQAPPKRRKMEDSVAARSDIAPPFVNQPVGGVGSAVEKTNEEPLISQEAPAATDDEGGYSMLSRKFDGVTTSYVEQLPERSDMNSAILNDEAPESTGNLWNSLQIIGEASVRTDEAINYHYEEHNRVDEQQGMDWVMTDSKEDDLWDICQTFDDSVDLESLVFEQQQNSNDVLDHDDNTGHEQQEIIGYVDKSSNVLDHDNIGLQQQEKGYVDNSNDVLDLEQQEIGSVENSNNDLDQQEIGCVKNSNNVVDHDDNIGLQQQEKGYVENNNDVLDLEQQEIGSVENSNNDLDQQEIGSVDNSNDVVDHDDNIGLQQQEMVCVENRQVEIDETFSFQSPNTDGVSAHPPTDGESLKATSQSELNRIDAKHYLANSDHDQNQCERKLDDSKGASFVDFFTLEQIRQYLTSLSPDANTNLESNSRREVGENTCQLCHLEEITLTALDKFCASCEGRIKHDSIYYHTNDDAGVLYCFCSACFKNGPRGNISCRGLSFRKSQLCKRKNNEGLLEKWVQCDKCEQWQHQICGLYNAERDLKRKAKYTCPLCRLREIEANGHVSVTPSSGAQDLPRTKLSDFIEERLFRSLEHERKERAKRSHKNPEDVPGASDLTVRVVLAVDKQLRVNQQFLDFLHDETYPTEFPYKSKVILLFQKVAGVDVCLFAMYVQEYGSECLNPNKRSVYISYLDSVKYFTPEIRIADGDAALRTFVYHEILIGYLDYCKRRGFANCYIWSCPSLKGDDYILLCHPQTQKRPHPSKLVQWYKKMLKKAGDEKVVVGYTNFYDHFSGQSKEYSNSKLAARLPYLDGDYWPRAIQDLLQSIDHKDNVDKHSTKRSMKAKDVIVMEKLMEKMMHAKDEFIIIHLHFTCMHCREAILSGSCWTCRQCRNFHLCSRCCELEMDTHTQLHGYKHQLHERPVNEVAAADTDDKDVVLDNDIFRERHSFLHLCEKNDFRFDSLRRAAHSSLMIVHHLHAHKHSKPEQEQESEEEEQVVDDVVQDWRAGGCNIVSQ